MDADLALPLFGGQGQPKMGKEMDRKMRSGYHRTKKKQKK
jgi:hypothetical protein